MKYKGISVQRKPFIYRIIMFKAKGIAFADKIALGGKQYEEFVAGKLSCETESTLEHELEHVKRIRKFGRDKKFDLKYWFDREFRFQEELFAIKAGMRVYRKNKKQFPIKKVARSLSNYKYLWSTSHSRAVKELEKAWREV